MSIMPDTTQQFSLPPASSLGEQVMQENPGFANSPVFAGGINVIDATPERQASQYGQERYSEFYFPGDKGGEDQLPNPGDTSKANLEIYKPEYLADPVLKKELVQGEMLHGMSEDPTWRGMRQEFAANFTPQADAINHHIAQKWAEGGEDFKSTMNRTVLDSYIRAGFMPHDTNSKEWADRLSPKQTEILGKMKAYLKRRPGTVLHQ